MHWTVRTVAKYLLFLVIAASGVFFAFQRLPTVRAQSAAWEVTGQPGGYRVARVAMAGGARAIGLTCERDIPVLAVSLAQTPRRNPAQLTLRIGTGTANIPIARNGTTNIWAAVIRDSRVLDALAAGQSASVVVDGVDYGAASLAGADAAMRAALSGCWRPAVTAADALRVSAMPAGGDPDEEAVRAIVGGIYGWRNGRKVKSFDQWEPLFTARIRALIAQCEAGVENADPRANGGESAYTVTGDQGCVGTPFLIGPVDLEPAPFIAQSRAVVRRVGPDTIESVIMVPPSHRADWGTSETMRFLRSGGRWLLDEITTQGAEGARLYSSSIAQMTAELRAIARKPAAGRRR